MWKATLTPERTPKNVAYSRIFHSEAPLTLASWCVGVAQPSQSSLALLDGVRALAGQGKWGCAGPRQTATAGLSEAGGGSWLGSAGGPGDPTLQMGSRWLVLAFPGLRSELLITHSPPPLQWGTPLLCVASPSCTGPAISKILLPVIIEKKYV